VKSHSTLTKYTYTAARFFLTPIIRFIWIKSHTNIHHIKKHTKGGLIASNHQSFFDFLCLVSVTNKNIHFLSAETFFHHKVWRILMIITGQIKVDRNAHDKSDVHQAVKTHLSKNHLVGIFPEGTRSPSSTDMLKAFTGVARYALEHGVPVIPVGIKGAHEIHNKHSKKLSFKKSVEIVVGEPMVFSYTVDAHKDKQILEEITAKIMKEIARLSGKNYPY
jgi:1-acyl-sn-glycerol-3-phosphate acyltransferase